ncbi:MAG: endonuclease III [Oscillospiraceae bacterium]|nr:endonuclease III [Oscillospiraceae bacterium]MBQ8732197.1 endonuclease III [Oscillospiraceae bacterium]
MKKQEIALEAVRRLEELYPDALCSLEAEEPYRLLIAVRLAAQCTDERVNKITEILFDRFPTLQSLADAEVEEIAEIVKPCGLFRTKARDISALCKILFYERGGLVPDTIEELCKLPGVGRKTANLIVGDVYGKPAVVVDTHCIRITNRLGLVAEKDPTKIEHQLRKLLPPEKSNDFCHRIVLFGRDICSARTKPFCDRCPLQDICQHYSTGKGDTRK